MFGLTFEKLFLVAIIAGLVIGPQRLPYYAHQFADAVRSLRAFVETTRQKAESEMGVQRTDWESLDLRQYDPRRIVREVMEEAASARPHPQPVAHSTDTMRPAEAGLSPATETSSVRPGQKYIVTGSAAHPARIPIDSLPPEDPRRIAARLLAATDEAETT